MWRVLTGILCLIGIAATGLAFAQAETPMVLWRGTAFHGSFGISVNELDATCWVADTWNTDVVHLADDGTELWRGTLYGAWSVSVDVTDGSVWVANSNYGLVTHLAPDGSVLWQGGGFIDPISISANPTDGSCWMADLYLDKVMRLAADGSVLWAGDFPSPLSVAVDPVDGSCWIGVPPTGEVVHVAEDGTELWRGVISGMGWVDVSVNPTDSSCWVAASHAVVHLASDGTVLALVTVPSFVGAVAANPIDGSCWMGANNYVAHLAEDGTELSRVTGFNGPLSMSVNPVDGSCWIAEPFNDDVVHVGFAPEGDVAVTRLTAPARAPSPQGVVTLAAVVANRSGGPRVVPVRLLRNGVEVGFQTVSVPARGRRAVAFRTTVADANREPVVFGVQAIMTGDPTPANNTATATVRR